MIVFGRMEKEHLEQLCVVFKRFREFNLSLNLRSAHFFQSEIVYLAHHISWRGILPSRENVRAVQEFPMPKTYMQVRTFCGLAGHYRRFIKGFANIAHPLYDVLGKEVKMGPVDLPTEAQEAVAILKGKVQSMPVLVFPNFEKPPVAFGSRSLTPVEENYHSCKLEFLTLKWSVTEHFKEYLAYVPFVVWTDKPLTYVLTNAKSRCYGALMGRCTGFISV